MYSLAANITHVSYRDDFKPRALVFACAQIDSYLAELADGGAQYI
jgi:hypothetical protein